MHCRKLDFKVSIYALFNNWSCWIKAIQNKYLPTLAIPEFEMFVNWPTWVDLNVKIVTCSWCNLPSQLGDSFFHLIHCRHGSRKRQLALNITMLHRLCLVVYDSFKCAAAHPSNNGNKRPLSNENSLTFSKFIFIRIWYLYNLLKNVI